MNSSGVSARFLELFKEKVERKKYELNWDHPLTVNDVIQYVLGPETTRSGRGYIQMLRNTYPKEKTSDLIRRPAEALVLHSSLSEYGVHFLEGLQDCFGGEETIENEREGGYEPKEGQTDREKEGKTKDDRKKHDEIKFVCVDIFTKVYQVELPPLPKMEQEEEEIEEILENLEQDVEEEEKQEEHQQVEVCGDDRNKQESQEPCENRILDGEVVEAEIQQQNDRGEHGRRQSQSPRSELSEGDDLSFYLNENRPKTQEKAEQAPKMPERLGAREGTPLQVESEVRSSRETSARVEVKADGGRGDEDGSRTKTEIKTGKTQQDSNDYPEASDTVHVSDNNNTQAQLRNDVENAPVKELSVPTAENDQTLEINLRVTDNEERPCPQPKPNERIEENWVLPEEVLMIGALLEEEGVEDIEEEMFLGDSRPLTRSTGRSIRSADSTLSIKTFSKTFKYVFVLVNWEEISCILESIEILEVIYGHCGKTGNSTETLEVCEEPTEEPQSETDSPKSSTILTIMAFPFTREKLQSRDLYNFYQTSFENISQLDMHKFYFMEEDADENAFEAEVNQMTKCVQNKLFHSLFQAVDHRKREVEVNAAQLTTISHSSRRVPRENYPDIDVSDADWLIQLARSKWVLGFKAAAMEIQETALKIKECLNGNFSQENLRTLREACDWALDMKDRNRAIELLLRIMEIHKQTLSDDNILFSALFTELGHVQDSHGQPEEALQSHSEALKIETLNRGSDHPDVATCQANIGRMHYKLSQLDLSVQFLNKALKNSEFYIGPKSSRTAQVYSYLGDTWLALKDGMKALDFYKLSLLGREASMEVTSANAENILAEILEKVGDAHMFRCDFTQALRFYGRALENRAQFSRGDTAGMDLLEVQHKYAKTLHCMSAYGDAQMLYNQVLNKLQTKGAGVEGKMIAVLEDLGLLYQETGELVKARKTFLTVTHMQSRDL